MIQEVSSILLKEVRINDPESPYHKKTCDILIENGVIHKISEQGLDDHADRVLELDGKWISPGWCDIGAHCGEPGEEIHETLDSISKAAAAGGFTHVGLFSNDTYPFDNKNLVSDIHNRSGNLPAECIPVPSISKKKEGKELAEFFELASVGPALFCDGLMYVKDASLIMKALEYSQPIQGRIATCPGTFDLHGGGQVNESPVSASMGLVGLPAKGEMIACRKDLELLEYTKGKMYFHAVTDRNSLDLILQKKKEGLDIRVSVPVLNLLMTDEDVTGFDENLKVLPPLRSQDDQDALLEALKEKKIDVVISNHVPISSEYKDREFLHAPFGAIGLQTVYPILNTVLENIDPDVLHQVLCKNPRNLLGIEQVIISENEHADLTIYDPEGETILKETNICSLSNNSALVGKKLRGSVMGVVRSDIINIS